MILLSVLRLDLSLLVYSFVFQTIYLQCFYVEFLLIIYKLSYLILKLSPGEIKNGKDKAGKISFITVHFCINLATSLLSNLHYQTLPQYSEYKTIQVYCSLTMPTVIGNKFLRFKICVFPK